MLPAINIFSYLLLLLIFLGERRRDKHIFWWGWWSEEGGGGWKTIQTSNKGGNQRNVEENTGND